ncbi:MAG: hypothetical protein ACO2XZ_01025 [Rickettsiales bacterium]
MHKLLKFLTIISLILPHSALAYDEEKFFAGISINSEGTSSIYLEYQDDEDNLSKLEKTKSPTNSFEPIISSTTNTQHRKEKKQILAYSGYKNVEGFKNNKRKNDITFASIFVGAGLVVITAGALTVAAIVKAIDN